MALIRLPTLSVVVLATAGMACIIAGLVFLAKPFGGLESEVTLVASRSLDGSHLTHVKIRSSLNAEELAGIIRPNREDLQSVVDSIEPGKATDKVYIRRIRRSILKMLGPEARLIEVRVNVLPAPLSDPRLEELIEKLPGTLGYTHTERPPR
jgi:hypothetical protein